MTDLQLALMIGVPGMTAIFAVIVGLFRVFAP